VAAARRAMAPDDGTFRTDYQADPRLRRLLGPGGPFEVEAVLFEHPAVADVAVIGVPDQAMGERVGAVVVPRPGTTVALDDLRAFTAGRLAAFKRPQALYLVTEIPQTPVGKTDKRRLRERLSRQNGDVDDDHD
jgi:acyl-CoA synthetase (AMP-forming)/AMP-acid ligase II